MHTIHHGDCLEVMRSMPDNSVHAIVTDPPYGLSNTTPDQVAETIVKWVSGDREYLPSGKGFMGKSWDGFVPPVAVWDEAMRVLKPGGHVLAFAGSRTHDLMTLGLRLAGFDIRDSVAWLYGSGFPKSMDVGKAVDKLDAAEERTARALEFTAWMRSTCITSKQVDEITGTNMGGHYLTAASQPAVATADLFDMLRPHLPEVPARIEELVRQRTVESKNYAAREVLGRRKGAQSQSTGRYGAWGNDDGDGRSEFDVTAPATEEAKKWSGWGTALKPAFEPVAIARKPFAGTLAANVVKHGAGGLNIDASRADDGRWPPNVVLDEMQIKRLDEATGAGRYFYASKASKSERPVVDGVSHPTAKPLDLMQWLVRMVTPPNGTVLDLFAGSGTTIEAAMLEGFDVIGIEREAEYLPLIQHRIDRAQTAQTEAPEQGAFAFEESR